MEKKHEWLWLQRVLFIAVSLIILYLLYLLNPLWSEVLQTAGKVLLPFIIAGLIAYLLHPIIDFFQNQKLPRSLSILLVYVVFFGGGTWLCWYFSPVIYVQIERFISHIPMYFDQTYRLLADFHHHVDRFPPVVHDNIEGAFERAEDNLTNTLNEWLGKWRDIFDIVIIMILLPFLVFYLLKDIKALEKAVKRFTPSKWRDEGHLLATAIDEALGSYIRGQFIVAGTVGLLAMLALFLIDVPNPILLGLFIGVTDVIPYFGPIIGAIPAVVAAAAVSTKTLVITIIVIFLIQQLEGNLLSPYIVGRNVHLHPLMIVFALLLGFEVAGILGLLIAVPVFVVVNNIFHTFQSYQKTGNENKSFDR
ncbi:AI-2E family transporter [Salibacterium salarium]|uniref:AI-2E family transporter n=1 Tax=Salibacterium salarium TaxID=284579 RepID=A0A3R9QIQ3_9BACI|nr:AI-2E family transporter [Salibacterium salarium]RSL31587.1 AI-2E family transporter [Salibacterium salarium]